jgi:uncharacterized damage-inducible protein DinB
MKNFPRPAKGTYPEYYDQYINLVPSDLLIDALNESHFAIQSILLSFNNKYGDFKYAEGKWTIKQVLMHIADTERILQYRILCIARGEQAPLPGFDEHAYAENCYSEERTLDDILEEMSTIRHSTITLLQGLNPQVWMKEGTANGKKVNVAAIAYMICGHEIHHRQVITERYVNALLAELKSIKQQPI